MCFLMELNTQSTPYFQFKHFLTFKFTKMNCQPHLATNGREDPCHSSVGSIKGEGIGAKETIINAETINGKWGM